MTKETLEKATELNAKIEEVSNQISSIKYGLSRKKENDERAKEIIKKNSRISLHHEEWTLKKFFTLIFEKRKVKVFPHYEFARAIEVDAEPELIDLILEYLQKKKVALEREFAQIGGGME